MSIALDTVLADKYRLVRIIGQGGMGIVYEAVHTTVGRKLAVKCLHRRYVEDEAVVKRFQQEAKLAGTIGHDNICEVIDFGVTEDGIPYLVMPLLSGASLETLFNREIVSFDRLTDIARQTLSALHAAFEANIVHRDLKPDNIFITKMGDRLDFVKLLDFGISKVIGQDIVMRLTKTGDVIGTAQYMSPEQAAGSEEIDQRTDLYALGVILYEGLTGRCPFEGESYNEIIFNIVNHSFPLPRTLNPAVPPSLERVVLKALAKDPEARFKTPMEMDAALQGALRETTPMGNPAVPPLKETRAGNSRMFAPVDRLTPITARTSAANAAGFSQTVQTSRTAMPVPEQARPSKRPSFERERVSNPAPSNRGRNVALLAAAMLVALAAISVVVVRALSRPAETAAIVPLNPADMEPIEEKPAARAESSSTTKPAPPELKIPLQVNEESAPIASSPKADQEKTSKRSALSSKIEDAPTNPNAPEAEVPETPIQEAEPKDTDLVKRGIKFEAEYE